MDVSVIGSLHLDIVVQAPRLPSLDETLVGSAWAYKCGGKGGNQAVAAAQFGARTSMGGCVGDDDFGRRLRKNLKSAGIDEGHVEIVSTSSSGMSVAILDPNGEYGAVIVSGANLALDPHAIAEAWPSLWHSRVLLLQNELTDEVNEVAAKAARGHGGQIVLNAAPGRAWNPHLTGLIDILVVNRVEASMLSGSTVKTPDDAEAAVGKLKRLAPWIIVTLGREGLVWFGNDKGPVRMPALPVSAISSHGAGDCFCGALAARVAVGDSLAASCDFACVAAGLFVAAPAERQALIDAQEVLARCRANP